MTSAETGEKFYSVTNPFGNFRFRNLKLGEIYILEMKSKRAGFYSPTVVAFDDFPIGFPLGFSGLSSFGAQFTYPNFNFSIEK